MTLKAGDQDSHICAAGGLLSVSVTAIDDEANIPLTLIDAAKQPLADNVQGQPAGFMITAPQDRPVRVRIVCGG